MLLVGQNGILRPIVNIPNRPSHSVGITPTPLAEYALTKSLGQLTRLKVHLAEISKRLGTCVGSIPLKSIAFVSICKIRHSFQGKRHRTRHWTFGSCSKEPIGFHLNPNELALLFFYFLNLLLVSDNGATRGHRA